MFFKILRLYFCFKIINFNFQRYICNKKLFKRKLIIVGFIVDILIGKFKTNKASIFAFATRIRK